MVETEIWDHPRFWLVHVEERYFMKNIFPRPHNQWQCALCTRRAAALRCGWCYRVFSATRELGLEHSITSDIQVGTLNGPAGYYKYYFDHDIYERAISFKRAVKIIPPTKQWLFRERLGLILLGFDGSPLKISRTPQILKEKAPYVVMYAIRRFWRGSDEKLLQWSPPG